MNLRTRPRRAKSGASSREWDKSQDRRAATVPGGEPAKIAGAQGRERGTGAPSWTLPTLDARRDTMDFRDQMFVPTLVEVPPYRSLDDYIKHRVPVLNQGKEGACTGYGLATVVHYLLGRRLTEPDREPVSARMLYEMARRYDEWPGENYSGSSARGAMKGWHKHGVCSEADWCSTLKKGEGGGLNEARVVAARKRPLGAYFRVNHLDLVAMHAAIAEVGILYATATVHEGWSAVRTDGVIPLESKPLGGHAFAIVAYDAVGLWIQNSWGEQWGHHGFARISYDDWLANGTDVWVARLGAPIELRRVDSTAALQSGGAEQAASYSFGDLRPHVVSIGNDGRLHAGGVWGTDSHDVRQLVLQDMPRVMKDWPRKRVLIYAHGGLVSEEEALQRVSEYRPALLGQHVYPIAMVWHSDFSTTLKNVLAEAVRQRRTEGVLDGAKDFLLDRLDDMIEPIARRLMGKLAWDEMKENATAASQPGCGADYTLELLSELRKQQSMQGLEIHLVGHSAGAILLASMLARLKEWALTARTCTLWAPACRQAVFGTHFVPALQDKIVEKLAIFMLSDAAEQEDSCGLVYNKSLLYLVSRAFESQMRVPGDPGNPGTPLLGMARYLNAQDPDSKAFAASLKALGVDVITSPNDHRKGHMSASKASRHGDFDNDERTVLATFARIQGSSAAVGVSEMRDPMSDRKSTRVSVQNPHMLGARGDASAELRFRALPSVAKTRRETVDRVSRPRQA